MAPDSPGAFAGRRAVVTGASGGIGSSIVRLLRDGGATVCEVDVSTAAGGTDGEQTPPGCGVVRCDVSDPEAVAVVFQRLRRELGGIDFLVNCAGISPKTDGKRVSLVDMSPELWRRILDVNLSGAFYCTLAVVPGMIALGGGAIVNITSLARSLWTGAASAAYIASKTGLDGFTRACAIELIHHGIRVNAVAPGRVDTNMTTEFTADMRKSFVSAIPMGRAAQPDEVARVVTFLLSDASGYIVGETIDVSGGRGVCSAPPELLEALRGDRS